MDDGKGRSECGGRSRLLLYRLEAVQVMNVKVCQGKSDEERWESKEKEKERMKDERYELS